MTTPLEAALDTFSVLAREAPPPPLARGLDAAMATAAGEIRARAGGARPWLQRAARVEARAALLRDASDADLRRDLAAIAGAVRRGDAGAAQVDDAFAVLHVATERTLGFTLHRVQIAAALALAAGRLVELATGEGKSLTAALAAAFGAFRGRGFHVITTNDYLATRDATAFAPLYDFAGLRAGAVLDEMQPAERRAGYAADVTYASHREVAADFVRDRLLRAGAPNLAAALARRLAGSAGAPALDGFVQRGLASAIVDEADSILLDDATTPLLLSGAEGRDEEPAVRFAHEIAAAMRAGEHYEVEPLRGRLEFAAAGEAFIRAAADADPAAHGGPRERQERVRRALVARELMRRDVHYVVEDDRIVIVDEATGRRMPDRAWREGLHAAVEAKEGVPVRAARETVARTLFVRFFRRYAQLAGMTGTAWEARRELHLLYGLASVRIPTHRPCQRRLAPPRVFASDAAKWLAIVAEIARMHAGGRPVLVGTRSVERSLHLSRLLDDAKIPHAVLNAHSHAREAEIVARAGEAARVTVATNMAGRGTDVPLAPGIAERGGLHVIASEPHASQRVDRQLHGRAGRQGDPGSAVTYASVEDDVVQRGASALAQLALHAPRAPDGALTEVAARAVLRAAQARCEREARRQRQRALASEEEQERRLGFALPE